MTDDNGKNGKEGKHPPRPCPICETPVTPDTETFPFCSARCRKIDLGKWLKEEYTISRPVEQRDLEEGE